MRLVKIRFRNIKFKILIIAQLLTLLGCKQREEKEATHKFTFSSPSLVFTEQDLRELKTAIGNASGSLATAYDTLMIISQDGLAYHTDPYLGDDSMEFYKKLREPAGLSRDLALAYALTEGEDRKQYGIKAIELMEEWAEKCVGVNYVRYAGTSMLIVRSLFPMMSAYDILKNEDIMEAESKKAIEAWFNWLVHQVREGISYWEENDYFNKQDFQNHLASHTLGLLSLGVVLEDEPLVQLGLDSPDNPRDLYELIAGCILMKGDTPHHREIEAPPPVDGEIYDRYRHDTNPLRGLGYAHLTLSQLALSAHILDNIGMDVFSYVAPGGENLLLPFEYYSDFYRLKDACIKSNYYCGEAGFEGKSGDTAGMFELGFAHYPNSQPLRDLINSGSYDRGTSYNDLLGLTRFYSFFVDQ